ncbi:hypothetical protein BcepSauron_216 [Burkholderia phage BcepSauron]|uniref:Uncharacterized protein n=1 Tax=Burkholderia phage BcepSauron TaxID=2530033 RepID=A0A482MM53_9CAUD|nr:hypothetical protein H1O17_gp216 [Burkholderia phage BcepSauron]QBQ74596.1 hypothetical protein BcepSauron_216 [Burkholderia phage BcepSauron]
MNVTRQVLELALAQNAETQSRVSPVSESAEDRARFARDFQTVSLSLGQRTGITTAVIATATEEDVIVSRIPNQYRAVARAHVMSHQAFRCTEGVKFRRIFIDCPVLFDGFSEFVKYVHSVMVPGQQLVIVGASVL